MVMFLYVGNLDWADPFLSVDCLVVLSNGARGGFYSYPDPFTITTPADFNAAILDDVQAQAEIYFNVVIDEGRYIFSGMARERPGSFWNTVDLDIGSLARHSGMFDIASTGLIAGKPVVIQQAPGPYTDKGDRADEAEMDLITATASVVDATTIRAYWTCSPKGGPVKGHIKFQYAVSG